MFGGGWNYLRYQFGIKPATQETGVLEKTMARWGNSGAAGEPLRPGTYVAIVARDEESLFGTPLAQEEAGFHVICGEW
jgi:hypothetical protein